MIYRSMTLTRLSAIPIALLVLAVPAKPGQGPQTSGSPAVLKVVHVIGMETAKPGARGELAVMDGAMQFTASKHETKVAVTSIDDIFTGEETTQAGGKLGRVVKTAALAAPYDSGMALSLLLRTKIDLLTVAYHGSNGELRGAIFALPKGQAAEVRARLISLGAHVKAPPTALTTSGEKSQ